MTVGLPPNRNVASVAELSAHPGPEVGEVDDHGKDQPPVLPGLLKPVSAVSPVARV